MTVRGLPADLASTFELLEGLALERGAHAGDKKSPIPVPHPHRDPAKHLWGLGLLTLNASADENGEYFSQAVLTPLAHPTNALVLPVCPVGDVASKVEVVRADGKALLLTTNAGADLASMPSPRSPRARFEVRHWNLVSTDHNQFAVLARLDLAAIELVSVTRWGTEVMGVVVDAALSSPAGEFMPCDCDLEEAGHSVVSRTEPAQDEADIELIGARVHITLSPVQGRL